MRIATWNINGIRARHERLLAWLRDKRPDVLCLQEIKCEEPQFPRGEIEALGYATAVFGQKAYNGVAILATSPLSDVERGFCDGLDDDPQARLIAATVAGVRVMCGYFPNGKEVGSEAYGYKLAWISRLRDKLAALVSPTSSVALCGDFNVAPSDRDVYDPAAWAGKILCSEPERAAFRRLLDLGLVDAVRHLHPDEVLYTWWDYRELGFPKNRGMRLDHVLLSAHLAGRLVGAEVDRNERKGKQASDHAPVVVELS
jgi:exodeoxyribonuclease-3